MTDNPKVCEYCGTPLAEGASFCEACGQQVRRPLAEQPVSPPPQPETIISPKIVPPTPTQISTPSPTYTPPPAYVPPPAPPKRRSNTPILVGVGGCLVILCIALCAVVAFFFLRNRSELPDISKVIPVKSTQLLLLTNTPLPTQPILATRAPLQNEILAPTMVPTATQVPLATDIPSPSLEEAPVVSWPAGIGQQLTEAYFSDDFSTDQYDWANIEDDIQSWGIEDEHYALHLFEAEYSAWAYLPIEFTPTSIGFDAAVQQGYDQGAYGVICYYQDEDNYHFIAIDPFYKKYSIGYVQNGEYEMLLEDMWMSSQTLNDSPYEVNSVLVVCDPDMITLFMNGELEAQATLTQTTAGSTAVFGETWEDTPSDGFKVLFDNLYAFKPVQ